MPSTCYLGHANCVLSNVHLDFLAQHTVKDWNRIVLILQVEQSVIDEISVSCKTSSEKAYEGYQKWHQKFPKETCCCALFEALKFVGRNDIISLLKKTYGFTDPSLKQKCHYELTSVCYFVGREEEVQEVKDFCKTEQRDAQLLVLLGLPGIGKTEIINEALQSLDRNKIVRVNFITRENIKWSFENIAQCILKKWKSVIDHDITGDIDLFDVLGRKNEGVILVLEFAHLDFDDFVFPRFYNAIINQLLRNKYSELKIITTCCQLPNYVHTEQVFAKVIYVRDLNKEDSIKLINGMNPALSSQTCEDIFNRCGGSPFMLRKIGAETKQFCGSQEKIKEFIHKIESPLKPDYLSPLIRRTVWLSVMTNVFDALDVNEKTILVKLSVFHKVIPEWCITEIFNGKVDIEEVDHLCNIHCILDKIDNNIYQISELYKTFIWEYTAQEKNKSYKKIQEEAKVKVTKYFLNFLSMLASMFFSKSTPCTNFIEYHRKICPCASGDCRCNNFLISKDIFIRFKYMILKSLHRGIQCHPQMTVSVLLKSIQFLRHVLPHEQLVEVCVTVRKEDQQLSAREQAVLLANMVFIKIHKGCTNEQEEYKKMLDLAIKELRNYQNYQNSATYEECLLLCLLKRAYIKAVFLSENAEEDLEVASEKIKKLKKAQRIKFNLNGVTADVLRSCKEDKEALLHRRKQVTEFLKYLGDHLINTFLTAPKKLL